MKHGVRFRFWSIKQHGILNIRYTVRKHMTCEYDVAVMLEIVNAFNIFCLL